MRIVINATAAVAGGSVTYLLNLLPALVKIDSENEYIILLSSLRDRVELELPSNLQLKYVNFPSPRLLWRLLWEQTILPTWLGSKNVDVLYAPLDIAPFIAPCSIVLAIRNSNPFYSLPDLETQVLKFKLQKQISCLSAHRAKKVIFVSQHSRDTIASQLNLPLEKTEVVYHGLDREIFDPGRDFSFMSASFRRRIESFQPFVLCVSTINPHKNYALLFQCWAQMERKLRERYKLVVAGRCPIPEYHEELVALIEELGINEEIILLGEVPYRQIPFLYKCASAFVFPSLLESFGHPLVEAMAMKVPIVAASSTCIPEIVDGSALLFEPRSLEDLSLKLERVLTESDLRETLIKKGQRRAHDFSWQKTARKTLDILKEAADVESFPAR